MFNLTPSTISTYLLGVWSNLVWASLSVDFFLIWLTSNSFTLKATLFFTTHAQVTLQQHSI